MITLMYYLTNRKCNFRSSGVAEGYVAESLTKKIEFADKILHTNSGSDNEFDSIPVFEDRTTEVYSNPNISNSISNTENSITVKAIDKNEGKTITFKNCTNCTFNFYNK